MGNFISDHSKALSSKTWISAVIHKKKQKGNSQASSKGCMGKATAD